MIMEKRMLLVVEVSLLVILISQDGIFAENRREKRHLEPDVLRNEIRKRELSNSIDDQNCLDSLRRTCGFDRTNDDLIMLGCIETLMPNEVSAFSDECQHTLWKHITNLTSNENIKKQVTKVCSKNIAQVPCLLKKESASYLTCLIDNREAVKDPSCLEYIQRLEWVAFSDFSIITPMVADCQSDIERFKCGRIQSYRDFSQGQMLACLQNQVEKLNPRCKKQIFKVSEVQADNIRLDRQLYMACTQDHLRFCSYIRPGSGQVYKCLMQHKLDQTMTKSCQDQLARREKLIASDYKVSRGLARACKEDIKINHCRRLVSDDKEIRLAQILLCLESAMKNGTKIDSECQKEMIDHRKILLEDYRLSPEIVNNCARDISKFCNSLEVGGITIHCLMSFTKPRKTHRISPECQRALETLVKQTDAGEDWRVDPILREACQSVVESSCQNVRDGNARVIYCLMGKLGSRVMVDACETALYQIQYFVARDYKLDPQLYQACHSDAVQHCHAKHAWADDGNTMDPERGPLILPCLHRIANHPSNVTLRPECAEEIRRIMRQRAISVDLQPEVEEVCLDELAAFCYSKTGKGEEVLCLQEMYDKLSEKCRLAVSNLTEDQAEHVELNPVIMSNCQKVIDQFCVNVVKFEKDEGDMMECLIQHKNEMDQDDYKCKAAIENFQLISLKDYRFTYKFKEACKPFVKRYCQDATTKAKVIRCLSEIVQDDIIKDKQHRIQKDCRGQLRGQLSQQRENIKLDPILLKACAYDRQHLCKDIKEGNSQVVECLLTKKSKLTDICHKQLFKERLQDFQLGAVDYLLMSSCRSSIKLFCNDEDDKTKILDCLKRSRDKPNFDDERCKNIILKRMIEQNTDYRFNVALQVSCSKDIIDHCKQVFNSEPTDKELEGKVVSCLKIQFRKNQLTNKCKKQMTVILRQAALHYQLNPILASLCSEEIEKYCKVEEEDEDLGKVEECLKQEFNKGNLEMKKECRVEIASVIEESKADIHVDPLLHKTCSLDLIKYCSDVPQGNHRHILCLKNAIENPKKPLQSDCYNMLMSRIEMFRRVDNLKVPNSIGELYSSMNESPSRSYFMLLGLSMIGSIFVVGIFCGRVFRRSLVMKNK